MFALVADVEAYPEFLPLCKSLSVEERFDEGAHEVLLARMGVGYKAISESYLSRVLLNREDMVIEVTMIEGPMSHLSNHWTFRDIAAGRSKVDFYLEYEMRSMALRLLMGSMFDAAFAKFAESFEKRADQIYARAG